jgi:uncharacterized membrane protein YkvA (DUF1232 family)
MNFFTRRILFARIGAIKSLMKDVTIPKRKKALVVFGIVYLLLPVDIIPAVIFPVAWMDDALLWLYIIWNLKDYLDNYWMGEPEVDYSKKFDKEKVVESTDFKVDEEKNKS